MVAAIFLLIGRKVEKLGQEETHSALKSMGYALDLGCQLSCALI